MAEFVQEQSSQPLGQEDWLMHVIPPPPSSGMASFQMCPSCVTQSPQCSGPPLFRQLPPMVRSQHSPTS